MPSRYCCGGARFLLLHIVRGTFKFSGLVFMRCSDAFSFSKNARSDAVADAHAYRAPDEDTYVRADERADGRANCQPIGLDWAVLRPDC
jgi:hypothetical protein